MPIIFFDLSASAVIWLFSSALLTHVRIYEDAEFLPDSSGVLGYLASQAQYTPITWVLTSICEYNAEYWKTQQKLLFLSTAPD
jgi:hypothetical protein